MNGASVGELFFGLEHFTAISTSGAPELEQDDEELAGSFPGVSLAVGEDSRDQGAGTLHITTRRIIWCKGPAGGFSVPFSRISMHAVSQGAEPAKAPCIYAQLEGGSPEDEEEDDDDDDAQHGPNDIRLIPEDDTHLQDIFQKMCDCAALNPDSDMEDDEHGDDELYYDEEEAMAGAEADARIRALDRLDSVLQLDDGIDGDSDGMADGNVEALEGDERFEDPDEDIGEEAAQPHGGARRAS